MTARDIAFLGCRLIALYWGLEVVYTISAVLESIASVTDGRLSTPDSSMNTIFFFGIASSVTYAVIAFALWFLARPLSNLIVKNLPNSPATDQVRVRDLQAVAFSAVGLFVVLNAIPDLLGEIYRSYSIEATFKSLTRHSPEDTVRLIRLYTQFAVGLLLLLGGGALSGAVLWLREFGMKNKTSHQSHQPTQKKLG